MANIIAVLEELASKAKAVEQSLVSHTAEINAVLAVIAPLIESLVPGSAVVVGAVEKGVSIAENLAEAAQSGSEHPVPSSVSSVTLG